MFRIAIRHEWLIGRDDEPRAALPEVLALLAALERGGNLVVACRTCGVSYRHGWGLLRRFERAFGVELLQTRRRQGSTLAPFAQKLLWADKRIQARLAPTLESLASELEAELERSLPDAKPVLRIHASHGFAVAALAEQFAKSGIALELKYEGGKEALLALGRGTSDVAGFHLPIGALRKVVLDQYRTLLQSRSYRFVHLAVRTQGIMTAPGNPKQIHDVRDFARSDVRIVNRNPDSGTRTLLDLLLAAARIRPQRIQGYENTEFTHAAVAAYIASGKADAGLGVEPGARMFGLDFQPIGHEDYLFAFNAAMTQQHPVADMLAMMQSDAFRKIVSAIPGYDGTQCGEFIDEADL